MQKPVFPPILAIDFDGTIVTHAYPAIGELRKNVIKNIKKLHDEGFYIIIWTCRNAEYAENARKFLTYHEIPFHTINENNVAVNTFYGSDTRKISADCYIDDRQLGGIPDDWDEIYILVHRHLANLKIKQA